MYGDKPWNEADRKAVSISYHSLETEGRRIAYRGNPLSKMDTLTTVEIWRIMEESFIRPSNITFDSYMLLTTKQSKAESFEQFFGKLKELSENCELGNREDILIKDLFTANMQESEFQRKLLRKTVEPSQASLLAVTMEFGRRNQLQITNSQLNLQVNAIIPQRHFRNSNQRPNFQTKSTGESTLSKLRPHLVSKS